MALHSTALLKNIKASLRKFLFDNLTTIEGIDVTFDDSFGFQNPEAASADILSETRWIDFTLMNNDLGQTQAQDVKLTLTARGSDADDQLIDLRDILMKYLTNPDSNNGFKTRTIPFYDIADVDNLVGNQAGYMTFVNMRQSSTFRLRDNTKFMIINATVLYDSRL